MGPVDVAALLAEDEAEAQQGSSFAYALRVQINMQINHNTIS